MRLACPNCDAKYDVPDDAIPENGRDVQCSNCGFAWFQFPFGHVTETAAAAIPVDEAPRESVESTPEPEPAPIPEPEPIHVAPAQITPEPVKPPPPAPEVVVPSVTEKPGLATQALSAAFRDAWDEAPDDEEPPEEPARKAKPRPAADPAPASSAVIEVAPVSPDLAAVDGAVLALLQDEASTPVVDDPSGAKRPLDNSVLSVLREEAALESEARRQDTQRSGRGKDSSAPTAAERRVSSLRAEEEPVRPAARRDLLPDVEELTSTLQPDDSNFDPDAEIDALPDLTRNNMFRFGFLFMVLLLVAALAVYVWAPTLAQRFPSLAPTLEEYVIRVEQLRGWLNDVMDRVARAINGTP